MLAVVTGASSGIGREIARELSSSGYEVVLVGRNEGELRKTAALLQGPSQIRTMDLTRKEERESLIEEFASADILVNNAGFGIFGEFLENDEESAEKLVETNVIALQHLTCAFLRNMVAKDEGRILNVASIAGFLPGPLMASYYASKAYVVRLSEAIREELRARKSKATISILCPGPVDTSFSERAGVRFALKGMTPGKVASYAVPRFLKGRFYLFPDWRTRAIRPFLHLLPSSLLAKIAMRIQRKKS